MMVCGLTLAALPLAAQTASPSSLAGVWKATLGGQLPLVLHLDADSKAALTATMDSPAQGANGLACTNVKLDGAALSFDVPSVAGNYTGTVKADGKTISGTWTQTVQGQQHTAPLEWAFAGTAAQAAAAQAAVKPSPIDGNWAGALNTGSQTLHVVFHFKAGADGILCSMDSVDQGANGIPCGDVKVDGKQVSLTVKAANGTYAGTLRSDRQHIDGTWTQGSALELDLTKQ
ncbi:MAG: hypothetical protein WA294_03295 [Acidobacteriaceae bacterium]